MVDEGILYKPTYNRFDQLICAMLPDKGRDTVRKHGDYEFIMGQAEPWSAWTSQSYINPTRRRAFHLQPDRPRIHPRPHPQNPRRALIQIRPEAGRLRQNVAQRRLFFKKMLFVCNNFLIFAP